ncbi:nudC domain-containing protein 3 [Aplysia californica]|uniref:NudC domain-containing protein 3 n=1 Tax=Aplysia californica TaxID=6500 RepID=A0ABM0K4L6_APLCA|nr:nudC domain-containing protein 3 [Aplysia californica]
MASGSEKYDTALLAILQNEGKVAPFLDEVLGFLYRRTDFFRIMKTDTDRLGFPPGVAYKLLKNIFKKYEILAQKDSEKADQMRQARKKKQETQEQQSEASNMQTPTEPSQAPLCQGTSGANDQDKRGQEESAVASSEPQGEGDRVEQMETSSESETQNAKSSESKSGDGEDEEDPELARQRRELQANPLTYNGAEREAYFWSQNITEVDVRVKVPKSIVKGKQMKVDIKSKHIHVALQESDGSWRDLVNSELSWDVDKEESMWTLSPGEFVHINLEKKQERWWENVFTDEPKINTKKIDCSRPMTDLDDEAQAKIEEMMFNQRQKQLGLPQSHEVKTHEMLRKAWDAEGSPFKGQPFDPSRFSVDPSGVVNFNQQT